MRPLRVLIRADGGAGIGGGHIMRCLTLADALAPLAELALAATPESLAALPRAAERARAVPVADPHDPEACADAVGGGWDVLIIDHYRLDAQHGRAWRPLAACLVAIDDLADRDHEADILLDQTLGRRAEAYADRVPPGTVILTGAEHALLLPAFAARRGGVLASRAERLQRWGWAGPPTEPRLLLSTGLGDPGGRLLGLARALLAACPGAALDLAVGRAAPSIGALHALAAETPALTLREDWPDMAGLMASADLAIGAMGTTAWERCCLGLPTLALVLAENQAAIARALSEAGAAALASHPETDATIAAEAAQLLADPARLTRLFQAAAAVVDGQGAPRLAGVIRAWLDQKGAPG